MFENGSRGTGSNVKSLSRIFLSFWARFSVIQYIVSVVFPNPFLTKPVLFSYLLHYHFPIHTQS